MSTLVVILTAMVVPGIGPEAVSAEMVQGLDLSWEWEGTYWSFTGRNYKAKLSGDWLKLEDGQGLRLVITDEGGGKAKIEMTSYLLLSIYRQEGDRVIIALRDGRRGWPVSLRISDNQHLLILHCVKPGK
ncbi:MAG TPA: hypothetical protein VH575_16285 [Gemmataceae bacterium]|jgi:hypothetical protein